MKESKLLAKEMLADKIALRKSDAIKKRLVDKAKLIVEELERSCACGPPSGHYQDKWQIPDLPQGNIDMQIDMEELYHNERLGTRINVRFGGKAVFVGWIYDKSFDVMRYEIESYRPGRIWEKRIEVLFSTAKDAQTRRLDKEVMTEHMEKKQEKRCNQRLLKDR